MAVTNAQTAEAELDRQKAQKSTPSLWTRKAWVLAPLACALCGLLISVTPHLVSWAHTGSAVWIADDDEPGYLSYASQAYFNHPFYLSDPVFASGRKTIYPWLQLVPGVLAAKFFGLGPFGISLVWRTWAGISIGIGWYLLASDCTRSRWIASAVALLMLADAGGCWGQPLWRPPVLSGRVLTGPEGTLFNYDIPMI